VNATPGEEWRPIIDGYEVSNLGRVRSLDRIVTMKNGVSRRRRGRILKPFKGDAYNHQVVSLGHRDRRYVHILVLNAFVGPRPSEAHEACHNDGDPLNNALANLRWDTASANQRDRLRHGTHHYARRTHCDDGHKFTPENTYIRVRTGLRGTSESRVCRTCKRARGREEARRRRERRRAA
jgi:hypothetical protein